MKIAIVVTSCDAFQECWEPFIFSINKFWEDCPWDIYIISNHKSITSPRVRFIKVGDDNGWASNLKIAINQISADFIIYLHEDFFINKKVMTSEIIKHLNYCNKHKIDYLRLAPPFFDKYLITNTSYALSPKSKRYRLCLQASIWNKKVLDKLLIPGFSAWQFEWKIDRIINKYRYSINSIVIHSSHYPLKGISYVADTAVHKGMWTVNGYNFLIENGFGHILKSRKKEGKIITLLIHNKLKFLRPIGALLLRLLIRLKINI